MPQLNSKFERQQRTLLWSVTVALLVVGLGLAALLYVERAQTLQRESDRLLHQVRIIDANLSQQLEGMASAIQSVATVAPELSAPEVRSSTSRRLRTLSEAMPGVRTMQLTNASGRVLASNRPEVVGFDASQRAYFLAAKDKTDGDALYVSEPFKTILGAYSLNLVKTWVNAQGQFGGVVTATLDPEYIHVLLNSVLYAQDMRATLVHGDGRAFLTTPKNSAVLGAQLAVPGTNFSSHMASGRAESVTSGWVPLTGEDRLIAFRTIQPPALHMNKPLALAVSRDLQTVFAPWRTLAWICGLTYGLVSMVLLLSVYFVLRQQRVLLQLSRRYDQNAIESAQQLDLALHGADLGLWDVDLRTGARSLNRRSLEMAGNTPEDPPENMATWVERIHPDDREQAGKLRTAHQRGETDALIMEYRIRHRDGHWVWLHSRGKVTHRDADGTPLRFIGTYQDISERKAAESQIAEFAYHDSLTGLPNRRLLMDRLTQAQHASARSGKAGALLFLDLDRFKWINDNLGHDMGDVLLQEVSTRLQSCFRTTDTVARLGGDEFVVVVQDLGVVDAQVKERAQTLAEKVLRAMREPVRLGDVQHTVTCSIGIAIFVGLARAPAELFKHADSAMYRAKAMGRNTACVEGPESAGEIGL
ncbi:MAG: hypothetical protein RIR09_123 [Pseudomonadota bacterium]